MLIRTQNKEAIIDISGMTIKLHPKRKDSIIAYSNHYDINGWEVLGVYSSEEKATEVLNMIQNRYISSIAVFLHYGFVKNTVFEMQEDSEVDV